jgi:hypothetical protein
MKYIKVFEEFIESDFPTIGELTNTLTKFSVPIDSWGTGESKSIDHLFDEIKNGECHVEDAGGYLVRYIEFVGIRIFYKENDEIWHLKEDKQVFNDGRTRRRNIPSSVSEKMKFGEDPRLSSVRGIKEELGVDIEEPQLIKMRDINYNGDSLSYPGLKSIYKGYQFTCYLTKEQYDPNGYIEVQKDKSTFFKWVKKD